MTPPLERERPQGRLAVLGRTAQAAAGLFLSIGGHLVSSIADGAQHELTHERSPPRPFRGLVGSRQLGATWEAVATRVTFADGAIWSDPSRAPAQEDEQKMPRRFAWGTLVAALRRMSRWILLVSAALAACGGAHVAGTARITSGPLPAPSGVYVPAQTSAVVRLEGPLDTATSSAGQTFVARLVDPLRGADGRVLAPAGARVDGHVAAIELGGPRTQMRLAFDRIETVRGIVPVAAQVVSAQYRTIPGSVRRERTGAFVRRAERLVMPAGSTMTIVLARPIVLGAR